MAAGGSRLSHRNARLSYSFDGRKFVPLGEPFTTVFLAGSLGPKRWRRRRQERRRAGPPPSFTVIGRGQGRIALRSDQGRLLSVRRDGSLHFVAGRAPGAAETFQWIETLENQLTLMSLATNRYLSVDPATGHVRATHPGPTADPADGVRFVLPDAPARGRCPGR